MLWDRERGQRMALIRMKLIKEQKELARDLGVTQATISRLELGYLKVCESITVAGLKKAFDKHFGYVAFGSGAERYNRSYISKVYWDTRLRVRRKNKGENSKSRL